MTDCCEDKKDCCCCCGCDCAKCKEFCKNCDCCQKKEDEEGKKEE